MIRFATVATCALLLAASATLASQPPMGMQNANKSRWEQVDKDLASMDDNDAKAARVLGVKALYGEDIFSRLIHLPCDTTRDWYVAVLTDEDHPYNWNAHYRKLAAWGLGVTGEPRHAEVLKKVATEDPLTNDRAGSAPMMKGSAREAAQRGLEELVRRHPAASGWLR